MRPIDIALCRLESLETFSEILGVLSPKVLAVVALRYEGYLDAEIGEMLGISRQNVSARVRHGRKVIERELPHLKSKLDGRAKSHANRPGFWGGGAN